MASNINSSTPINLNVGGNKSLVISNTGSTTNSIVLGQSLTDTNNFLIDTDIAGTLRIRRGSDGSGGLLMTINSSGIPLDKDGFDMRPIGVGQTWQNVTVSRAFGTTYTNNTGRTIEVKVLATINGVSASNVSCTISGVAVPFGGWYSESTFTNFVGHATIPAGATYNIASPGTLVSWVELR